MRHAKQKKSKDRVSAIILLCFCLIALTSIFTIQASIDKVNKSAGKLPASQKIAVENAPESEENKDSNIKAGSTEKSKRQESADLPVSQDVPIVDSVKEEESTPAYLPPVSLSTASVTKDYSMDMVIYNKTLDQYMTHPGIDLEAPAGSGVNAIASGIVTELYEDDAYGTSIEITHDNGLISKYKSLESSAYVEKGDAVSQGQQIGTIGKTALYESMESAHLHFELEKDGKACNPSDYISFQ